MRIAVTGAAGYLGSGVAEALGAQGHVVVGLDREAPRAGWTGPFHRVELTDPEELRASLPGADLVVHCASIHPWKPYTDSDYLRMNVEGTWQLYAACEALGIGRVVLTSSIAAMGYGAILPSAWPAGEEVQCPLGDLYSYTKHAQELTARLYADRGSVRTVALRPPAFMPAEGPEEGLRLLGSYALREDMVSAHVAAVGAMLDPERASALAAFEPFVTTNALPYSADDAADIGPGGDLRPLARKYWPEAAAWLDAQSYQPGWLTIVFDLTKAERLLGWRPRWDFGEWVRVRGGG